MVADPVYLDAGELRELVGSSSPAIAAFFGISERTLRAWLKGRARIPAGAARLAIARWRGDLEVIFGPEARELRFHAGALVVPGWRRGITLHELRTLWVRIQGAAALQSELANLERELEAAQLELSLTAVFPPVGADVKVPRSGPHAPLGGEHRFSQALRELGMGGMDQVP
jgi:hypothetical protein